MATNTIKPIPITLDELKVANLLNQAEVNDDPGHMHYLAKYMRYLSAGVVLPNGDEDVTYVNVYSVAQCYRQWLAEGNTLDGVRTDKGEKVFRSAVRDRSVFFKVFDAIRSVFDRMEVRFYADGDIFVGAGGDDVYGFILEDYTEDIGVAFYQGE